MKQTKTIFFILLLAGVVSSSFFALKSSGLNKELNIALANQTKLENELKDHQRLMKIDSMLLIGEYNSAINSYEESLHTKGENNMIIPLRIAFAEKLLKQGSQQLEEKATIKTEIDSLIAPKTNVSNDVREVDSLSFILEKVKVQLSKTRKQLQQKSYGEYLKFKNTKGSIMHYVGQVKNGKANGFGIALLNTGSRYEGQWKNNQRHGEGTYHWPDGEYYVGSYTGDKRDGYGTYYWPNGEKYSGEWHEDKRNGSGKFFGTDGAIVTKGEWQNDKLVSAIKKGK